jgi:hypothetical protein
VKSDIAAEHDDAQHYVFRVKKRVVHGLSVVLALWFALDQHDEIVALFSPLFHLVFGGG